MISAVKLKAQVEKILPEMAMDYATGNTHQRDLSDALVRKYLREMNEDRWQLNGEPIIFSDTGKLLDGQHRMKALALYGKPLEFLVVRGVEESAFSTIDTGSARKGKDVFSIKKIHNPLISSAICKACLMFERTNGNMSKMGMTFSNEELLEFYDKNTEIVYKATKLAGRPALKGKLCSTAVGLLVVLCRDFSEQVERFFVGLETGANLAEGDAVLTLRNRLAREREGLGRMPISSKIALTFKAWNAFISEKPLPKISYAPEKEQFPVPIVSLRQLNKSR